MSHEFTAEGAPTDRPLTDAQAAAIVASALQQEAQARQVRAANLPSPQPPSHAAAGAAALAAQILQSFRLSHP